MSQPGPRAHGFPPHTHQFRRQAARSRASWRRSALLPALLLLWALGQGCRPAALPALPATPPQTDRPLPSNTPPRSPTPTASPTSGATPAVAETILPVTPTEPATLAPPTPPPCLGAGGRIEKHQLYTELSSWPWEFRVYVPPCYDEDPEMRYPSLYLVHGSTYTDDQWDRLGADEAADRLIASGEIPAMLIVMPRDRRWVEPADDPFGQAVADHILPWVEANYRARPGRENRAIGGLSRGAAWAVHLGLSRWELFSAIGAHSLPVFWSDTGRVRGWLADIPADRLPRIYMDIGESDYLIESAIWFEGVLDEMDIPHEWHLFPGRHEEAYWEEHLESYLRWYAAGWQ